MPINIVVTDNYGEMSKFAASKVAHLVDKKTKAVLGLPTGSTPLGMYQELIKMHKQGLISFRDVITFNLDEYVGINPDNQNSYHRYMYENFFNHIDIDPDNIHILDGNAPDLEQECRDYEEKITRSGGIDLVILGLGRNGHIAFNEPGPFFSPVTHKVSLEQSTIEANARFFQSISQVPKYALTMGIGTIMRSRSIMLLASGDEKKRAVKESIEGPVTPHVPASVLQLHPEVTFVLDKDAASLLDKSRMRSCQKDKVSLLYGGKNK